MSSEAVFQASNGSGNPPLMSLASTRPPPQKESHQPPSNIPPLMSLASLPAIPSAVPQPMFSKPPPSSNDSGKPTLASIPPFRPKKPTDVELLQRVASDLPKLGPLNRHSTGHDATLSGPTLTTFMKPPSLNPPPAAPSTNSASVPANKPTVNIFYAASSPKEPPSSPPATTRPPSYASTVGNGHSHHDYRDEYDGKMKLWSQSFLGAGIFLNFLINLILGSTYQYMGTNPLVYRGNYNTGQLKDTVNINGFCSETNGCWTFRAYADQQEIIAIKGLIASYTAVWIADLLATIFMALFLCLRISQFWSCNTPDSRWHTLRLWLGIFGCSMSFCCVTTHISITYALLRGQFGLKVNLMRHIPDWIVLLLVSWITYQSVRDITRLVKRHGPVKDFDSGSKASSLWPFLLAGLGLVLVLVFLFCFS